jgi:hypothetical protein
MALLRTPSKAFGEKCKPTPNISTMISISANCCATARSPTNPGVCGPINIPAIKYPTMLGSFRHFAAQPPHNADATLMTILVIRGYDSIITKKYQKLIKTGNDETLRLSGFKMTTNKADIVPTCVYSPPATHWWLQPLRVRACRETCSCLVRYAPRLMMSGGENDLAVHANKQNIARKGPAIAMSRAGLQFHRPGNRRRTG